MKPEEILDAAREAVSAPGARGPLDALSEDRPAVAAAVASFAAAGDAASALELFALTWRIWFAHGELEAGGAAAAIALAAARSEPVVPWLCRVLYVDGLFASRAGDQERSRERNEQALEAARESGDVRGECDALTGLARVALRDGDYGKVVGLALNARARAAESGDPAAEAAPLHLQAAGLRLGGDYSGAHTLYLESLALNRRLGNDAWAAMEEHNLGWVELHLDNPHAAEEWFPMREAHVGPDAYGDAWRRLNQAAVAASRGRLDDARHLFADGGRALENLGVALDPDDQAELDRLAGRLAERHPSGR